MGSLAQIEKVLFLQGVVQLEQIVAGRLNRWLDIDEVYSVLSASAFFGLLSSGVFHQDPPHGFGRRREEVSP